MHNNDEIKRLKEVLDDLKGHGKLLIAILYGSYAKGKPHPRSDIDLGLYLKTKDSQEEMEVMDRILMAVEREVSILRLDDDDESPLIVQEALKGMHLVEPDRETLYGLYHRILHECESIRFRRELSHG